MATGETTVATGRKGKDVQSELPAQEESKLQDVSDRKQDEESGGTASKGQGDPLSEDNKQKPDALQTWYKEVVGCIEHINKKDKRKVEDDINYLRKHLIQIEERFESLREGYNIRGRLQETEDAIKNLKERLSTSNENSRNVPENISVSQESALNKFDDIYEKWNKEWSTPDHDSDLCKIHKGCHKFCKDWFEGQMKIFRKVARPQTKDELSNDTDEEQILQEAYKELARNTVETELEKMKDEGRKSIKGDKELKMIVQSKAIKCDKELTMIVQKCLEICWIALILKVPMMFEFEYQHAKKGTFEGETQDEMAVVIKPAIILEGKRIKPCGVRQTKKKVDTKDEDNNYGAQTEGVLSGSKNRENGSNAKSDRASLALI